MVVVYPGITNRTGRYVTLRYIDPSGNQHEYVLAPGDRFVFEGEWAGPLARFRQLWNWSRFRRRMEHPVPGGRVVTEFVIDASR